MPFTTRDAIEMARRCREEIAMLRREIDVLRPKAQAYDALCTVLGLLPRPPVAYAEDLMWRLDRQIEELQREMTPANPAVEEEV